MDFSWSPTNIIHQVEVKNLNKKLLFLSIILITLLCNSFIGPILARPFYKNVSVEKTEKTILSTGHPNLIVIDIRPDFMYTVSHIPGAINVPLKILGTWIAGQGQNYVNNKLIIYCHLGETSPVAAQMLVDAGFKKVLNMEGGFMAWLSSGYNVEP